MRRRAWLSAALEGFDDDHASAATGAWAGEQRRLVGVGDGIRLLMRHVEQFPRPGQVFGAVAIGEEAVVSDAVEAQRQDMNEEASDELVRRECHDLLAVASLGAGVLPLEGDALVVEADEAAV